MGSNYHGFVEPLPPRCLGEAGAKDLMAQRLPLLAAEALRIDLIDHCDDGPREGLEERCLQRALSLAVSYNQSGSLAAKQTRRELDEAQRPLAHYGEQELARMHRNCYGFDPSKVRDLSSVPSGVARQRWNKIRLAQELGLSRVGLRSKMQRFGMDKP